MRKNIVIILVMLIVFVSVILFRQNKSDILLDEVELKDSIYAGVTFAIMVENDDGDYEEYSSLSWPTGMVYNASLSSCIDNQGKEISDALSYSNGVAVAQTGSTSFCYLFFNIADIEVESIVNGVEDEIPITGSYSVITTTGSYWSEKYRTLNITSVSSNTNSKYSLQFTTDSSTKTNLRDYIVNLVDGDTQVTSGNGYLVDEGYLYYGDYTNVTALTEENYGSVTQFSSSSNSSTSGTEVSVWSYADDMWTSDSESMTSGTYYHLLTTVETSGYYQMCYSMTGGYSGNILYVYINETAQYLNGTYTYIDASNTSSKSGCVDLGYIESGDTVKFTQRAYSYSSYSIASMSVSLELGTTTSESAGIRYEGANPNNYIWFNDEMWRIIGVLPTVVDENGTTENLVKIIRADSIGAYAYDGQATGYTGLWESNTLYTLLNSYYWGKGNGTGTDYCMGYSFFPSRCDFIVKGIDPSGYYGLMVQHVYWNTGASNYAVTPAKAYINEMATQTVGGYIGIMNASDYGYAYYSTDHSTIMNSYSSTSITSLDWLNKGDDWTMTAFTTSTYALLVNSSGNVTSYYAYSGDSVRPVLYLKSTNIYIADGTGSESDPYILGVE